MSTQILTVTTEATMEPTLHMKLTPLPPTNKKTNTSIRLRNIKLDPTRALEPARKKLSAIESQRIMAVFEDTIRRVELVNAFPYVIENIDRFRFSLGNQLADLFIQHGRIQSSYKEIRDQLDQLLQKRAKQRAKIELQNIALKEEEDANKNNDLFENYDDESDYKEEDNHMVNEDQENEKMGFNTNSSRQSSAKSSSYMERGSGFNRPDSSQGVSRNIHSMVREEGEEEERASSAKSLVGLSDFEPRIEEAMRNLGLVAQQVSHSCKNILRLFMANPAAMKVVLEAYPGDESPQSIVTNMQELREILMHKLLTNPEEEKERAAYLDEISKRERHNAALIEKLEKDLKTAIDEKDEEIRKNNDIIKRLQTDLHTIEKVSEENNRRTRLEAEKNEMADAKNSQQKSQKLQSEINALQSALNNFITEHRELEADLRAKKYKVENEVDNWIQKYDQDLGERQDEYEEIDTVYTEEKKQLLELEERFATLEKEYLSIMEERRVARSKLEKAQRELEMLVKAATTIQAFWRSYKVRKALKAKSKKKGGRKGGKKK
ncbi:unnamed protein product [Lymnaea stagnalis]|uniref:Dynein regulatory complex protein 10 n=1 Tax=Lymnaea stagnalis TaxID=6523 RepID=A0AAV2H2Z1_LYMST